MSMNRLGFRLALLWLPPVWQEVSDLLCRVIECGLLSGPSLRRLQRPPARMVICGAGPNLNPELAGSKCQTGFPVPDRFDPAPIQVVDFSHLFASPGYPRLFPFTPPLPEVGLDNLPASSAWPTHLLAPPTASLSVSSRAFAENGLPKTGDPESPAGRPAAPYPVLNMNGTPRARSISATG